MEKQDLINALDKYFTENRLPKALESNDNAINNLNSSGIAHVYLQFKDKGVTLKKVVDAYKATYGTTVNTKDIQDIL